MMPATIGGKECQHFSAISAENKHIIEELADSNFNCHAVIIGFWSDCSQGLEADIADLWVLLLW
jgi:hypothetical protein